MKKVLFASFESLPFVKVGGLADVVYALPKAINKKKYKVKVVMPLFKKIKDKYKRKLKYVDHFKVKSGKISTTLSIYTYKNETIQYYFLDSKYFNRKNVYGYKDDDIRYSLFSLGVVEMMIKLNYYPDIVHVHDYHTSMIPAICKIKYKDNKKITGIKHILTIHNLVYQGWYKKSILVNYFGFDKKQKTNRNLIMHNRVNFMKAGICYADAVTTVSKTYAKEIQTPKYGYNLYKILRNNKRKLYGIVNGIDTTLFSPKKDKNIKVRYDVDTYKKRKYKDKLALQKALGLKQDKDVLLVGMVSRLTFQKGADLILKSINKMLKTNVQIAILGTGEGNIEKEFKKLSSKNSKQFAYYCGYNEELAHKMYAGLDMLLMPSKFEPCGISQLISMTYGTLPLVRVTGGLKDTVIPLNTRTLKGTGFRFKGYSAKQFYDTYKFAYDQYYNYPSRWNRLIKNAMRTDVSFNKSAKEYEEVYKKVI